MPDETRASRRRRRLSARAQTGIPANLRLFALLTVLIPLFGGLQYLAREAAPRGVEQAPTQAVVEAVPVVVPVEVPVERVVFVPIERLDNSSPNVVEPGVAPVVVSSSGVAPTTLLPTAPRDLASGTTPPEAAGAQPAEPSPPEESAQAAPPQVAQPRSTAEAQAPELPVMGIVAIVPRPAPAPRSLAAPLAPARVAAPADEPEDSEPVADTEDGDEAEVAVAPEQPPAAAHDDPVPLVVGSAPAAVVNAAPARPGRVTNPSPSEPTLGAGVNVSNHDDDEQQAVDEP